MIGRVDPVKPFELLRWARDQATVHGLRTLEAHVLLLLATYANAEAKAWPSIKTLALDCGLKPTRDGRNSAVSAALARLQEMGLVWTEQGGHGHAAKRELMFNPTNQPSVSADGSNGASGQQPSAVPDGCDLSGNAQPSGYQDNSLPATRTRSTRGTAMKNYQEELARGSLPATRKASHPDIRKAEHQAVAAVIRTSIDTASEATT